MRIHETSKAWRDRAGLAIAAARDGAVNLVVEALRRALFRRLDLPGDEASIRRILIFRVGNVGDIAAAAPTMDAIRRRFPAAEICLLTSPGVAGAPGAKDLIVPGSLVDSLIVYYKSDLESAAGRKHLLRRVRSMKFDLFIELSNVIGPFSQVMKSILLARLAGCRYAVGFRAAKVRWFPRAQALRGEFQQESERLLSTVVRGLDLDGNAPGRLAVSAEHRRGVRDLLARQGVAVGARIVVMHTGAKRPANRWFEERYAEVADTIQSRLGLRVVLTGTPQEKERVGEVTRRMRTTPAVLCGQLDLLQTAALIEQACLYVGNDTGPMHLAALMGTPAVAIFSARDFPVQWHPYGSGHLILRKDVPCSPCFKDECDRGLICLEQISVDEVLRAVELQLEREVRV